MDSKQHGGIDLHIHSTASDGTFAPLDLLRMASSIGLRAIAITDHDTLEGARAVRASEISLQLKFLTGVEISTQAPANVNAGGSMHVLGYGIDLDHPGLLQALAELRQARASRTPRIVELLNRAGIRLSMEQVMAEVGDAAAGRPHVATALIKMGMVKDVDEAFDKYLGKGRPAYVDKYRIDCRRAFDLIRAAGGIPVLAHPYLIRSVQSEGLKPLLEQLLDMGLMGVEAYYPEHEPQAVREILELAQHYRLLITGGTDFHGTLSPDIQLGCGKGEFFVPYSVYEALEAALP